MAVGCAICALAVPRPVAPNSLPALVLDQAEVRAALEADRELARAKLASPVSTELKVLFEADNQAEHGQPGTVDGARRRRLAHHAAALPERERDQLRAQATERALAVLFEADVEAGGSTGEQNNKVELARAPALLGSFPELLERYGVRAADGRWLAPRITVHAAYKARWNMLHRRERLEGLRRIERQALEGFVALHAERMKPEDRAMAARNFFLAGGQRSTEAFAVWLFQGGGYNDGFALMKRAIAERGELRSKNMGLAMWLMINEEPAADPGP